MKKLYVTDRDEWRKWLRLHHTKETGIWLVFYKKETSMPAIPYEDAVTNWYDDVYLPVVEAIREQGILRDFPGRTETDLYLWISEHHAAMERELGWEIRPEVAAADLAAQFSSRLQHVFARVGERILDAVTPDEFKAGPPPG